jgi:peptidoglycan hydrolase-like protein with peptidoglycan-binding domain
MKRTREILTAALLSASVGLGAQSLFAQSGPGSGSSMPGNQDKSGPTVPQPEPGTPQRPTIQPGPGLPQTGPIPGQRGTIPEIVRPDAGQNMAVTSDHIKKAQDALKAKGLNPGTDGRMDAQTQQALREFQKANDLPATGVLDEKTAAKLGVNLGTEGKSLPRQSTSPSSKPNDTLR